MDIVIFFSKYLFLLFIALLVISSFVTILQENEKVKINLANPSMLLIILFHGLATIILTIGQDFSINYDALIYCSVIVVFLLIFKAIMYLLYKDSDFILVNIMLFMLDIGFIFLYRLDDSNATRQLTFAIIGVVCAIIIPFLFSIYTRGFKRFQHFDYIFIIVMFFLLILPFFYGTETYGAKNWAYFDIFGGISFQPSEIVKLLFIFYLASVFSKAKNIVDLIIPTVVSFCLIIVLVLQNDFGGSLIFFTIYLVLLYVTTSSELLLLLGLSSVSFVSVLAYFFVYHVRVRVDVFLDPFKSPYDQGLQILQSLFAIGSNAPFGTGLTKGYPKYVPVVDSDFIFAGLSEEFGALFGLLLIVLIFILFMRVIKIAKESNQKNLILIALGIGISLGFQSFLIIGGNIKMLPLTGVTLPFISYGGTSVFMCIIMVLILLRIDLVNMHCDDLFNPFKFIRKNVNRVYVVFFVMYFALFTYLSNFIFNVSYMFVSSTYNPRVSIVQNDYVRGSIYDRDNTLLAYTEINDDDTFTRKYPYGRIFAHTVGSVDSGKTGLELTYNFILQNPNNELYQMMRSLLFGDYIYGENIITTFDADLQEFCYEQLGTQKGSIIVSEVETGKILSMVSYDTFNPRTFGEDFQTLSSDEENTPLINRATQGLYPPASTFKIVSSLDIIENLEDYENYTYTCTGSTTIDGETISCNNGAVHGEVTLSSAFEKSCNSYFATLIESLDVDELIKITDNMLFNQKIEFELPTSKSVFTLDNDSNTGEIMQSSIGQGETLITPLQLNMIVLAVANDGVMKKPYIVSEITSHDGRTIQKFKDEDLATVMTKEESDIITNFMVSVVESGTAKNAKPNNTTLAGKTGTAEVDGEASHGLFVGFAPADEPEIAITVVLENSGGSGSTLPIVKNIVEYYFNNN